jgi:hypothetical protein
MAQPIDRKKVGRKKGVPNRLTTAAREAFQMAFEGLGGVPALTQWAQENPTDFYKLFARLIPVEVTGKDGGPVVFQFPSSPATFDAL